MVETVDKKKLKICYVVSVDIALKFILIDYLKFLKDMGYDVYAVCSPGKWVEEIRGQGIKIKTIRIKRKITPFYDLISFFRLLIYFKKEKFDIVHTHTPKPGLLAQTAAKLTGVRIIMNTIHGFYFTEKSSYFRKRFFTIIEKISAFSSDAIFFVNKEDMETALKNNICKKEKIKYFGGGIDVDRFNPKNFSEEFILRKKKELGIKIGTKVIGIVARLVEEKGYLELFEALKIVIEKFPDTLLLAIGPKEPEKRDSLNPEIVKGYGIEKNVVFLGERDDVSEIYPVMDIFVLPSYREGLNISLLEAQAMQKPVIATNIRGCRESVEDGKTGILVSVKNSEELRGAIIDLFSNPEKVKNMGRSGRERVIREFDEKIAFNRMIKEYNKLIDEKIK